MSRSIEQCGSSARGYGNGISRVPIRVGHPRAITQPDTYRAPTQTGIPRAPLHRGTSRVTTQSGTTIAPTPVDPLPSDNDLQTLMLRLRAELDSERGKARQLRCEKEREVRETRDRERYRASIALKDLRARAHKDKHMQLEQLRESLSSRFDSELKKMTRTHQTELQQVQCELRVCRNRLQEKATGDTTGDRTTDGSTGTATSNAPLTFAQERTKLVRDLHDLRKSKRRVEEELREMTDSDRRKTQQLRDLYEQNKQEVIRLTKKTDIDIRKLLDEIKCKNRLITKMEVDLYRSPPASQRPGHLIQTIPEEQGVSDTVAPPHGVPQHTSTPRTSPLQQPTPDMSPVPLARCGSFDSVDSGKDETISSDIPDLTLDSTSCDVTDIDIDSDVTGIDNLGFSDATGVSICSDGTSGIDSMISSISSVEDSEKCFLRDQIADLNNQLTAQKEQLDTIAVKYETLEKKHNPLKEKLKIFLEKNIEITNNKREVEDRLREVKGENYKLKRLLEKAQQQEQQVALSSTSLQPFLGEASELRLINENLKQHVQALTHACEEKDNRIENIICQRRQQKIGNVQQKAVRFLLPAKVRSMVCTVRETYYGDNVGHTKRLMTVQEETEMTSPLDSESQISESELAVQYEQLSLEHLQLQKAYARLQRQVLKTVTPAITDGSCEADWSCEKEMLNNTVKNLSETLQKEDEAIHILKEQLRDAIDSNEVLEFNVLELKELQDKMEKTCDREPPICLEIAVMTDDVTGVNQQTQTLGLILAEKVATENKAAQTDENTDVIFDYEQLHRSFNQTKTKLNELESVNASLEQNASIYKYTQEFDKKQEQRYKEELASLRQQLAGYQDGRQYESDIIFNQGKKQKDVQQKLLALEKENTVLKTEVLSLKAQVEDSCAFDNGSETSSSRSDIQDVRSSNSRSKLESDLQEKVQHSNPRSMSDGDLLQCLLATSTRSDGDLSRLRAENISLQERITDCTRRLAAKDKELTRSLRSTVTMTAKVHALQKQLNQDSGCCSPTSNDPIESELYVATVNTTETCVQTDINHLGSTSTNTACCQTMSTTSEDGSAQTDIEESYSYSYESELSSLREENDRLQEESDLQQQTAEDVLKEKIAEQCHREDSESRISKLEDNERALRSKLHLVTQREMRAQDNLALVAEERARRINVLQQQLHELEYSNEQLNDSIEQLKCIEQMENTDEQIKQYQRDLECLKEERRVLKDRVCELEEQSDTLKQLVQPETLDAGELMSKDAENSRIKELQRQVAELKLKECKLLEDNHRMAQELQQLQEHLDSLQATQSDDVLQSSGHLETIELQRKLEDLETENTHLREDLMKWKLEAMTTVQIEQQQCREHDLQEKIKQLEDTSEQHLDQIESLTKSESYLKDKINQLHEGNATLEDTNSGLEEKLVNMEMEMDGMTLSEITWKDKVIEMQQADVIMREDLKLAQDKRYTLQDELDKLQMESDEIKRVINKQDHTIFELRQSEDTLIGSELGLKAKLKEQADSGKTLEAKIQELEQYISHQLVDIERESKTELEKIELKLNDCKDRESQLEEQISSSAEREKYLVNKVDILEQTEDKLMEQVMSLEEEMSKTVVSGKIENVSTSDEEIDENDNASDIKFSKNYKKELHDLRVKVDILLDTEESLMDKLQNEESISNELRQEMKEYESDFNDMEILVNEKTEQIVRLETQLADLKLGEQQLVNSLAEKLQQIEKLEKRKIDKESKECEELKNKLDRSFGECQKLQGEAESLNEKCSTSEKLIAELEESYEQQKHETESAMEDNDNLKKQQSEYLNVVEENAKLVKKLEKSNEDLQRNLSRKDLLIRQLEKDHDQSNIVLNSELEFELANCKQRIGDLTDINKKLSEDLNSLSESKIECERKSTELEKLEVVLRTRLSGYEETIDQLQKAESMLRMRLNDSQQSETTSRTKLLDIQKSEITMKDRLQSAESQNQDFIQVIRSMQTSLDSRSPSPTRQTVMASKYTDKQSLRTRLIHPSFRSRSLSPSKEFDSNKKYDDVDSKIPVYKIDSELLLHADQTSHQELVLKLYEMQRMEEYHTAKIQSLNKHLNTFRHAVETVAVTIETDSGIPDYKTLTHAKDSEFESKIQELVKSEVNLKLKVIELSREVGLLRTKLSNVEETLSQQKHDFQTDIEGLEADLDKTRRSEAGYKNRLQYGSSDVKDSQVIKKIQHLEHLVFDLELSERKLQNQVKRLKTSENRLTQQLSNIEQSGVSKRAKSEDLQQYHSILKMLKSSDSSATSEQSTLTARIAELEINENSLKRKLKMLENSVRNVDENIAPESPDGILKQRIRELENTERLLRNEILDLEHDRAKLEEVSSLDKTSLHEQSIELCELKLGKANLTTQIEILEEQEQSLQSRIDGLLSDVTNERQKSEHALLNEQRYESLINECNEEHDINLATLKAEATNQKSYITQLEAANERLVEKTRQLEEQKAELAFLVSETNLERDEAKRKAIILRERVEKYEGLSNQHEKHAMHLEHQLEQETEALRMEQKEQQTLSEQVDRLQKDVKYARIEISTLETVKVEKDELEDEMFGKEKVIEKLQKEVADMKETLQLYEFSNEHKQFASIPHTELSQLRAQSRRLTEAEQQLHEAHDIIDELRTDEGACGHMTELETLKSKLASYQQYKQSSVAPLTSFAHKAVQVYTSSNLTLRGISPDDLVHELKQALQHLSSEHPAVYKKFIRTLQPAPSDQPDVMRIYNSQVLNTPAPRPSYESQARVSHDVPSSLQTPLRVGPSSPRAPPRVVTDASPRPGLYAPYGTSATSRRPVSAPVIPSQAAPTFKQSPSMNSSFTPSRVPVSSASRVPVSTTARSPLSPRVPVSATSRGIPSRDTPSPATGWPPYHSKFPSPTSPMLQGHSKYGNIREPLVIPAAKGPLKSPRQNLTNLPDHEKSNLISSLIETLPSGDVSHAPQVKRSQSQPTMLKTANKPDDDYLGKVDESSGRLMDDLSMSLNFQEESDYEGSNSHRSSPRPPPTPRYGKSPNLFSTTSVGTPTSTDDTDSIPPPLPFSQPPGGKYGAHSPSLKSFDGDSLLLPDQAKQKAVEKVTLQDTFSPPPPPLSTYNPPATSSTPLFKPPPTTPLSNISSDVHYLQYQLANKEQQITQKNNEIDRLYSEIRDSEDKFNNLQREKATLARSVQHHTDVTSQYKSLDERYVELQGEHDMLQKEYARIQEAYEACCNTETDKQELEQIILKLRGQLQSHQRIELEKQDCMRKLTTAETTVKRLTKRESDLISENIQLCKSIEDMEGQVKKLRESHEVIDKVINQESENDKNKTDSTISSLRAKLYRLAQKCQEKDELIRRLVSVIQSDDNSAELNAELLSLVEVSLSTDVAEDYLNYSTVPSKNSHADKSSVTSPQTTPLLRTKNLSSATTVPLNSAPNAGDTMDNTSRTAKTLDSYPGTRPGTRHDLSSMHIPRDLGRPGSIVEYEAIRDYTPSYYSRSGRSHQEVPLHKGDVVQVLGPKDDKGYFEAMVHGKQGLVPANYLIPRQILRARSSDSQPDSGAYNRSMRGSSSMEPLTTRTNGKVDERKIKDPQSHAPKTPATSVPTDTTQNTPTAPTAPTRHVPTRNKPPINPTTNPATTVTTSALNELKLPRSMYVSPFMSSDTITHPAFIPRSRPFSSPLITPSDPVEEPPPSQTPPTNIPPPLPKSAPPPPVSNPHSAPPNPPFNDSTTAPQEPSKRQAPSIPNSESMPNIYPAVTKQSNPPVETEVLRPTTKVQGPPEPPSDLSIGDMIGTHSVLLTWTTPALDQNSCSNNSLVHGYKVSVNNRVREIVKDPYSTSVILDKLNLQKPQQFSIQTMAVNSSSSQVISLLYDGNSSVKDHRPENMTEDTRNLAQRHGNHNNTRNIGHRHDNNRTSPRSNVSAEDGERKIFQAVYDYTPNPSDMNTLSIRAGDVVYTYGALSMDGYYQAKVNGKRGLVPAAFLEEISTSSSLHNKKSASKSPNTTYIGTSKPRDSTYDSHTTNKQRYIHNQKAFDRL